MRAPAQMAGEARDPQRNVPRAVIGSVIVGTLLYDLNHRGRWVSYFRLQVRGC
jgi:amino acid transporter